MTSKTPFTCQACRTASTLSSGVGTTPVNSTRPPWTSMPTRIKEVVTRLQLVMLDL